MTVLIIIFVILVALVIFVISSYNGFVRLRNKTEEAFSAMDVSLKKRYDLIPNIVESVKGYAAHEAETMEKVIAARNMAMTAKDQTEAIDNNNVLSSSLKSLLALSENYPQLRANENFIDLQNQLSRVEEEIAGARRFYNGVVNKYNTKTELFPGNLIAGIFGFNRKPLYEVNEAAERETAAVKF